MISAHSAEFETSFALAAFPERVHREGVDYSMVKLNLKSPKDEEEDRMYYRDSLLATPEKVKHSSALQRIGRRKRYAT